MELVHNFNNELSSLYDVKPPISKAKMTAITKAAIKGIKLYKHVVQSVEKFIQKCRPEYKVPGLYVIDSIVRQSRHQFGSERDVFGPRFARNITATFQHLFKCPEEEKAKIVRVLNLWQKNNVFGIDVIQPLLDMANPNVQPVAHSPPPPKAPEPPKPYDEGSWNEWNHPPNEPFTAAQATHHHEAIEQVRQHQPLVHPSLDPQFLAKLKHLAASSTASSVLSGSLTSDNPPTSDSGVKFNKKLLDFDYGDEEEEEEKKEQTTSDAYELSVALMENPELLRQLTHLTQPIQMAQSDSSMPPSNDYSAAPHSPDKSVPFTNDVPQVETSMYSSVAPIKIDTSVPPPFIPALPPEEATYPAPPPVRMDIPAPAFGLPLSEVEAANKSDSYLAQPPPEFPPQDLDERIIPSDIPLEPMEEKERERSRSPRSSSRHRSRRNRSRSPRFKNRRSRSDSRQRSRRRHSRSRSRDREREKERERERERERKHRGLLPLKKNHLSVYSTTLWLGHLSKLASEADLSDAFGEYGTITKIDVIPPRGCAFICMSRRQDALRALHKLRDLKLHGITIKMAWAPGKGVKEKEYKDYWDVDMGVSHIPWDKLSPDIDLDALEEGGMIDEDSAPDFIKEKMKKRNEPAKQPQVEEFQQQLPEQPQPIQQNPHMIAPPPHHMGPAPVGPPPVVPGPMPVMTMPPFGVPIPGMIPPPQPVMMPMPMGVPPPNPMMMGVHTQPLLGSMLPPLPPMSASAPAFPPSSMTMVSKPSPDATPTEEEAFPSSNQGPPPYPPPFHPPSSLATGGNSNQGPPPSFPPPFPPPPTSLHNSNPSFSIHYPPPTSTSGTTSEMAWMGKGDELASGKNVSYPPLVPPPFIPKGQPNSSEFNSRHNSKPYNNNMDTNNYDETNEADASHYRSNEYYKNYSNTKARSSRNESTPKYDDSNYKDLSSSTHDEAKNPSSNNEPYPFPEDYMDNESTKLNDSRGSGRISPSPTKSRPLLPDPIQEENAIPVVDSSGLRDMLPKEFGRKDNLRDMVPKEFGRKDNFRDSFSKEYGRKDNFRDNTPKEFGRRDRFNRKDNYRDNYNKRDSFRDRDNFQDRRDKFNSGNKERRDSFTSENTFQEHPVEKELQDFPPPRENFNAENNYEEFPTQPPDGYNPDNFPPGNNYPDFPPHPRDHFDSGNNYQEYPPPHPGNFGDFPPPNDYHNFPHHPPPGRENFPPMGPRHPMDNFHHPMGPPNNFPDHPPHMMENFPPPDFFPRPRGRGGPFRGGPRFFPPPGGPRFPPRGPPDFHPRGGPWMRGGPPRFRARGGGFRGRRNDWDRQSHWPHRDSGQEFPAHQERHSSTDDVHETKEHGDNFETREFSQQHYNENIENSIDADNKEINSTKNEFNSSFNDRSEENAMETCHSESDKTSSSNQDSQSNRRPSFVPPPGNEEDRSLDSNTYSKELNHRNPRRKSRWSNKPNDDVTANDSVQENFDDSKSKNFNADYSSNEQESGMESSSGGPEMRMECEPHPAEESTTTTVES